VKIIFTREEHGVQSATTIESALAAVGDLLAADGAPVDVVVVGGATLNLLGIVSRTTRDVYVIAQSYRDRSGTLRLAHAEPFPRALEQAISTVARDLGLEDDWMNAAVGKQWSQGLPPGIEHDLEWRRYGALQLGLVGQARWSPSSCSRRWIRDPGAFTCRT
jgi:hypothetical protein